MSNNVTIVPYGSVSASRNITSSSNNPRRRRRRTPAANVTTLVRRAMNNVNINRRAQAMRVNSRATNLQQGMNMDSYIHCLLAGASISGLSDGFPDGNSLPSVTIEVKYTVTLKPTAAGSLAFGLVPTAQGSLYLFEGSLTQTAPTMVLTPGAANGFSTSTLAAGTAGEGLITGMPSLPSASNGWGVATHSRPYDAFRNLMCVAEVVYSGSTMLDNGAVTVGMLPMKSQPQGTGTYTYATSSTLQYPLLDSTSAGNITAVSSYPISQTFAAREPYTMRVIAPEPEYQPIGPNIFQDDTPIPLRYLAPVTSTGTAPGPNFDMYIPNKVSVYSGLDQSASITVTVRQCIQLAVNQSSNLLIVSKPSPTAKPAILQKAKQISSKSPIVEFFGKVRSVINNPYVQSFGKAAMTYMAGM